ncbi:MAG TPA: hypothetical protein DG048_19880 [Pseudoalteromonas sp.]|nr:hypothetical protein [Pseudoalteromonas sp.]|tara:strand:+ start:1469 stop:1846 length:378 start_codon:yes stop_codon:yes gene_type:complete
MNIFSAVLGPVTNLAGTWMKNKHEQGQAKHQAKMQVIQNDANWEDKMASASDNSFKDEFWTIVLAVPIFMVGYAVAFDDIAVMDRVHAGFDALSNLPDWYQYLLFIAVSASFGIRGADKLMKLRK